MISPRNLHLPNLTEFLKIEAEGSYGWGEDWDLVMADLNRVEEFIDFYENGSLSDDEKNILMQLIIASYDDRLEKHPVEQSLEHKLSICLSADIHIHEDTFEYWMRPHKPLSEGWHVTPMLRKLWTEYKEKLCQKHNQ